MPTILRKHTPAAVLLLALAAMLAGCGDSDDEPSESPTTSTEAEATSDPAEGLDPAAVEASILEFLFSTRARSKAPMDRARSEAARTTAPSPTRHRSRRA